MKSNQDPLEKREQFAVSLRKEKRNKYLGEKRKRLIKAASAQ